MTVILLATLQQSFCCLHHEGKVQIQKVHLRPIAIIIQELDRYYIDSQEVKSHTFSLK